MTAGNLVSTSFMFVGVTALIAYTALYYGKVYFVLDKMSLILSVPYVLHID
jgi:hypothetical protein